jgi:DNA-binding CsgD family transcriptional regulator
MHVTDQSFVFVSDMVFNLAANLVTLLAAVCVMVLAYRCHNRRHNRRHQKFAMPVVAAVILWSICLVLTPTGFLDLLDQRLHLLLFALVYGIGSMVMTLAYVQIMAYQKPSNVMSYIVFGALLSIVSTRLLLMVGAVSSVVLSIVFMVVSVACLRSAQYATSDVALKGIGLKAFMLRTPELPHFEDIITDDACPPLHIPLRKRYHQAFLAISDTLVAACTLEAVVGLLNTFMLGGEYFFSDSEWVTSISLAISTVIFAAFVLMSLKVPSSTTVFKNLFVVLSVLLMLLPFLDTQFGKTVNIVLLVGYDSILFITTYTVITTAHNSGLSSHVLMGAFMSMMRFCLLGSLLLGYWFGTGARGEDNTRYILIVFIAVYLLSMVLVFFSRSRKWTTREAEPQQPQADPEAVLEDSFVRTCGELARRFGLTCREEEILAYLGRGRSSSYIGKALVLSPNTVRAHIRSIYSKLDVHSRQELIDLFGKEVEVPSSSSTSTTTTTAANR